MVQRSQDSRGRTTLQLASAEGRGEVVDIAPRVRSELNDDLVLELHWK